MPVLPSYRNQSTDLLYKSINWFLYEATLALDRLRNVCVRELMECIPENHLCYSANTSAFLLKVSHAWVRDHEWSLWQQLGYRFTIQTFWKYLLVPQQDITHTNLTYNTKIFKRSNPSKKHEKPISVLSFFIHLFIHLLTHPFT